MYKLKGLDNDTIVHRVYDSFAFLRDPCGFFVFPVVKMQTTKCSKVAQSTPMSYPP